MVNETLLKAFNQSGPTDFEELKIPLDTNVDTTLNDSESELSLFPKARAEHSVRDSVRDSEGVKRANVTEHAIRERAVGAARLSESMAHYCEAHQSVASATTTGLTEAFFGTAHPGRYTETILDRFVSFLAQLLTRLKMRLLGRLNKDKDTKKIIAMKPQGASVIPDESTRLTASTEDFASAELFWDGDNDDSDDEEEGEDVK